MSKVDLWKEIDKLREERARLRTELEALKKENYRLDEELYSTEEENILLEAQLQELYDRAKQGWSEEESEDESDIS